MAFPWRLLHDAPDTGSMLVEDLVMGIEIALQGHPAESCPTVHVTAICPEGTMPAFASAGGGNMVRSIRSRLMSPPHRRRILRAATAAHRPRIGLLVPPLSLLVVLQGMLLGLGLGGAFVGGLSLVPAALAALSLCLVGSAVTLSWIAFGRQTIALRHRS